MFIVHNYPRQKAALISISQVSLAVEGYTAYYDEPDWSTSVCDGEKKSIINAIFISEAS